jgi:hypothetical protein
LCQKVVSVGSVEVGVCAVGALKRQFGKTVKNEYEMRGWKTQGRKGEGPSCRAGEGKREIISQSTLGAYWQVTAAAGAKPASCAADSAREESAGSVADRAADCTAVCQQGAAADRFGQDGQRAVGREDQGGRRGRAAADGCWVVDGGAPTGCMWAAALAAAAERVKNQTG